ncbi:hypothetical protein [Candidatus Vondammii sp. HM_W22]|uniref:hypothetical protein n=1 Tax=Candidatus Vondammii sp. HM_W22 TaxID=2687299 RepID=UPI001F136EFE|nr:hypothetical protein [Candidatus Vondammii sp. HM_W22]
MKGLKGLGGAAAGIATGKAVEAATGVAPVFVTNWPGGGMLGGGIGGGTGAAGGMAAGGVAGKIFSRAKTTLGLLASTPLSKLGMFGAGAVGTAGAGLAAAGAAGYGIGTLIDRQLLDKTETGLQIKDAIGEGIAHVLAFFGSDEARQAIARNNQAEPRRGEVVVHVRPEKGAEARADRPHSGGTLGLEVETEAGVRVGGAW